MTSILAKCTRNESDGRIQCITPENSNWRYVGFSVYQLQQGQVIAFPTENKEYCLVLVSGKATVVTDKLTFEDIGQRMSPFERTPPYSVYVPHQNNVKIIATTALELAVCSAPSQGELPARLIAPNDVGVEHRGKGVNQRLVHNILPDDQPAESLLVVEVYTDEGNTSSYPSHKHDHPSLEENYLEETYYHRFDPPQGFALQRVYTEDRTLDECVAAYNHDVVRVPRGYHPVATMAGYDNYYLNVMAGPVRKWKFSWEKEHAWINGADYPKKRD